MASFSALRPDQMASAASLFNFVRTLFGAIGTSVVMTLWERREAVHHTHLTEHVDVYDPLVRQTLETLQHLGMDAQQGAGYLAGQITRQGFILAANEIYWLCAIAFLGMISLVWLAGPPKRA